MAKNICRWLTGADNLRPAERPDLDEAGRDYTRVLSNSDISAAPQASTRSFSVAQREAVSRRGPMARSGLTRRSLWRQKRMRAEARLGMALNLCLACAASRHDECMAYCELCEMNREYCEHGPKERRGAAMVAAGELLISPNGMDHFPDCPHKGDDPDCSRWAKLDMPRAWERLGNGERLRATGGERLDLVAGSRCQDCVSHGPW